MVKSRPVPIIAHEGEVVLPVKVVKKIPPPGPRDIPKMTREDIKRLAHTIGGEPVFEKGGLIKFYYKGTRDPMSEEETTRRAKEELALSNFRKPFSQLNLQQRDVIIRRLRALQSSGYKQGGRISPQAEERLRENLLWMHKGDPEGYRKALSYYGLKPKKLQEFDNGGKVMARPKWMEYTESVATNPEYPEEKMRGVEHYLDKVDPASAKAAGINKEKVIAKLNMIRTQLKQDEPDLDVIGRLATDVDDDFSKVNYGSHHNLMDAKEKAEYLKSFLKNKANFRETHKGFNKGGKVGDTEKWLKNASDEERFIWASQKGFLKDDLTFEEYQDSARKARARIGAQKSYDSRQAKRRMESMFNKGGKVLSNKKVEGRGAGWHERRLDHSKASVKGKMRRWRKH